jgi:putative tricarboxylic transport membrane protein
MSKAPFAAGVLLSMLGGGVIMEAARFPKIPGQTYGPDFFPTIIGVGLLIGGLSYAFKFRPALQVSSVEVDAVVLSEAKESIPGRSFYGALIWLIIGLFAVIMLWEQVGFILLLSALLAGFMILLQVPVRQAVLAAIVGTALVYSLFIKILMVPLPAGVLSLPGL